MEKNNSEKIKEYDKKVVKRLTSTLPDNYITRLIRLSIKDKNYIPSKVEISMYREMTILRQEKFNFIKQVKQELNIKQL